MPMEKGLTVAKNNNKENRDRRIGRAISIAYSSEIYRIEKETYKVQSESDANRFYIVRFLDGCPLWCSCKDFEIRSQINKDHLCKHMRAVVYAEAESIIKIQRNDKKEVELEFKTDDYSF